MINSYLQINIFRNFNYRITRLFKTTFNSNCSTIDKNNMVTFYLERGYWHKKRVALKTACDLSQSAHNVL